MAGKRVKAPTSGILGKILKAPGAAGEGLATYLLEGLYLDKKKKKAPGAKTVKSK